MVGHACNPSARDAESGGQDFEASLGYIVKNKTKTNKKIYLIHM